jgi:hypothetical protein
VSQRQNSTRLVISLSPVCNVVAVVVIVVVVVVRRFLFLILLDKDDRPR